MPSIVLLIRSRLRILPRSFSIRMPSTSPYWRLIFRRPASSLGRSASSSASSAISPNEAYLSRLEVLLLRALPIANPPARLARASDDAAVLLADQVEALAAEAGELGHLALGSATGTDVFLLEAGVFLSGLCLLLCHDVKCSRLGLAAPIWTWKSDQRLRKTTRPLDATIWPGASTKVRSRGRVVNSPTRSASIVEASPFNPSHTDEVPHLCFTIGCRGHPWPWRRQRSIKPLAVAARDNRARPSYWGPAPPPRPP